MDVGLRHVILVTAGARAVRALGAVPFAAAVAGLVDVGVGFPLEDHLVAIAHPADVSLIVRSAAHPVVVRVILVL